MTLLDVFAAFVLLVLLASAVILVIVLGSLPGKIARGRKHPYAQAVTVAGWVGLPFVVLWPLALVWAFTDVPRVSSSATEVDNRGVGVGAREGRPRQREAAE